jgi:DNA-binding transcriptional ArsR family regulator
MVNRMVNYQTSDIGEVFSALADPTRRAILEHLAKGSASPAGFADIHGVSRPAISRHLRVLERAGLLRRERRGRVHELSLDPKPLEDINRWIEFHRAFWDRQLDSLERYLNRMHKPEEAAKWPRQVRGRTSRSASSASSRIRAKKSSRRGRKHPR